MKRMMPALLTLLLAGWLAPPASAQHLEAGAYADYMHLSQTDTNMAGLGGRLGFNVAPAVQFEAEMSYDFDQAFTEGFTSSPGGTVSISNSNIKVLKGLFGPKLQTRGPVKIFVTVKGGFINFSLNPVPGSFSGFTSSVENLRANNVSGMLYPGGGIEANLGPIGLRLDVGDDIYFNGGAHHNLSVQFGPVIHF